jgi:hypothetical protein
MMLKTNFFLYLTKGRTPPITFRQKWKFGEGMTPCYTVLTK